MKLARGALGLAALLVAGCSSSSSGAADGSAGTGGSTAGTDGNAAGTGGSTAGTDGGAPHSCPGGAFIMNGILTCADTFAGQVGATGPSFQTLRGTCGGYLVALRINMGFTLACLYDPTTKSYVGARLQTDTTDNCLGAGVDLSAVCLNRATYPGVDGGSGG